MEIVSVSKLALGSIYVRTDQLPFRASQNNVQSGFGYPESRGKLIKGKASRNVEVTEIVGNSHNLFLVVGERTFRVLAVQSNHFDLTPQALQLRN